MEPGTDTSTGSDQGGGSSNPAATGFRVVKLVADQPGIAAFTDPNLVDAWGLLRANTEYWMADQGTGKISMVDARGAASRLNDQIDLGKTITGLVRNTSQDFQIHNANAAACGAARLLASNLKGQIVASNSETIGGNAVIVVDRSAQGAIYTSLTLVAMPGRGNVLLAADIHNAHIDMFDANFNLIADKPTLANCGGACPSMTNTGIPAGFTPFDVVQLGDSLYVTYAKQNADKTFVVVGPDGEGQGMVDVFDLQGSFVKTLIPVGGLLNAPWGVTMAPVDFCHVTGNKLLVGNFGNGRITAFEPDSGRAIIQLMDSDNKPIVLDGLWALLAGDKSTNDTTAVYFTSGPNKGAHGLFGRVEGASSGSGK